MSEGKKKIKSIDAKTDLVLQIVDLAKERGKLRDFALREFGISLSSSELAAIQDELDDVISELQLTYGNMLTYSSELKKETDHRILAFEKLMWLGIFVGLLSAWHVAIGNENSEIVVSTSLFLSLVLTSYMVVYGQLMSRKTYLSGDMVDTYENAIGRANEIKHKMSIVLIGSKAEELAENQIDEADSFARVLNSLRSK